MNLYEQKGGTKFEENISSKLWKVDKKNITTLKDVCNYLKFLTNKGPSPSYTKM